ncbi:MAG: glycogen/starch/alpha-glucan phosphorylase [Acutalibacteraceae bacterium]
MKSEYTVTEIHNAIKNKLIHNFGITPDNASDQNFYKAVVLVVRDIVAKKRAAFEEKAEVQEGVKHINYLCMEFLMGRSLKNTLSNLGLCGIFDKALSQFGVKLDKLYDNEPDAGLGNGGLGRLAACFLDALATDGYPAKGYSIRYEYGIFRQKLVDGWQTELPEFWLPGGEIWLEGHKEQAIEVRFDGEIKESWDGGYHTAEHINYSTVIAVPYDLMVAGQDGRGVSVLRLFAAKAQEFDMSQFNNGNYIKALEQSSMAEVISKVLYPADNHPEGKSLRLRQQYFLVSAAVQDIVKNHLSKYATLENLPEKEAIHINDTHPTLAIPELMRILLDECGFGWEKAWDIVTRTIAYTNHTVMSEALECWSVDIFKARLPRIYQIVVEIDNRHRRQVWEATHSADIVERTSVICGDTIRMANLAVLASHHVNGVSRLHSEILKDSLFNDFYRLTPEKFTSVTNGIAHRRWLCQANPMLSDYITELIGNGFIYDASKLEELMKFTDDKAVLKKIGEIKRANKVRLAKYVKSANGIDIDPDSIYDMQVKRMHEYKRQHLNALHILSEYIYLHDNPNAEFTPKTYIFGAKAASGYFMAKQIIQLLCCISKMIENDPAVRDKLKVIYIEDYRVTLAELMIPAADISEQISLAGTEASGTGNMKLMLNGAVTLGTEDGANVEIHEAVGDDNIIIFGLETPEVEKLRANGYNPGEIYNNNPVIRRCIDMMRNGIEGVNFSSIADSLTNRDYYMVLADFEDYCTAQKKATELYLDRGKWERMSLVNTAKSGIFAADRAIEDYAKNIWNASPVRFE